MAGSTPTSPRRRGRVRSLAARDAILAAALELLQERGYAQLTIEGIAARAGAGKQTIYRWWSSKADVVLEALNAAATADIPDPDTGALVEDLRGWLRTTFAAGRRQPYASVLPALMAAAQLDPAFGASFRTEFLATRRAALRAVLDRAVARGEAPAAVALDTLVDVVYGVLWYRLLSGHAPLDDTLADELVVLLAGGA